jgi:hypothetical protein
MAETDDSLVATGTWGEVRYAIRPDKSMPAKAFYDALSKGDKAKLNNLFDRMADHGRINHREKFKQVEGDLFAFKSFRIRVSCYQSQRCWYLLHGFEKKGHDWPRGEVIRALNLLVEHRGH